jgi:hypothetical protein
MKVMGKPVGMGKADRRSEIRKGGSWQHPSKSKLGFG